jgi:hypothetical protein
MSKSNIEILDSFLSADTSVLESSNAEILQDLSSVVDEYLEGETEDSFNNRIEQVLTDDSNHAGYLRDLITDNYFKEDTNDVVKTKIVFLSNSNTLLKDELEFRTDLKKLYLIENRSVLKKKLQELTEIEAAAATASVAPAASISPGVSYFKSLAIAASVLLVVVIGYFIFRNPQQSQIAKVEYKRIPIGVIGIDEVQGFAGDGPMAEALTGDSCVIAVIKDSINAYRFWNDTLILKTKIKVDSIKVTRKLYSNEYIKLVKERDSLIQGFKRIIKYDKKGNLLRIESNEYEKQLVEIERRMNENKIDKIYLQINNTEYQIMESEEFLKLDVEHSE